MSFEGYFVWTPQSSLRHGVRIALISLLALACSDTSPDDPIVVADTLERTVESGVEAIRVPRAVLNSLPTRQVASIPDLVIGEVNSIPEESFGYVAGVAELPDRSVAVADAQVNSIQIFDRQGDFLYSIGGAGEGPGEFGSLGEISVSSDTLYAMDQRRKAVLKFNLLGEFMGRIPLQGVAGITIDLKSYRPQSASMPYTYRKAVNGYPRGVPEGDGPHPVKLYLSRYDTLEGARIDSLDAAETFQVMLTEAEAVAVQESGLASFTVGSIMIHPLSPELRFTFLGNSPVTGWSDSGEISFLSESGKLVRKVHIDPPESAVSADDSRYLDWVVSRVPRDEAPIIRRSWSVLEAPESAPKFFGLEAGREGDLWVAMGPVEVSDSDELWTRWLVVDTSGMPVEWVLAPTGEVSEIGRESILYLTADDLGVQRIAVHRY